MYDSLMQRGFLVRDQDLFLTAKGTDFVQSLDLKLAELPSPRTPMCRECLDWSERRAHLAGRLGRTLLAHFESLGWVKRLPQSRALRFSKQGRGISENTPLKGSCPSGSFRAIHQAGKPAKRAITAVMRKLLELANALIRDTEIGFQKLLDQDGYSKWTIRCAINVFIYT